MLTWKIKTFVVIVIVIIGIAVSLYAYSATVNGDFSIETRSPHGTFRVVFEGQTSGLNSRSSQFLSEKVSLKVFKGQKLYFTKDPFFGGDALEMHFKGAYPTIEWINDSVLRMGGNTSAQPFLDEIKISNNTEEKLGVVEVFYGRYERFLLFDFDPGTSLTLSASPQFSVGMPPASTVIYKATNLASRQAALRMIKLKERNTASDGPLRIAVEISDP